MIGYRLLRRTIGFAFILVGLSVVIFTVARIIPGDPARMALGPLATNEQVAQLQQEMGFSKPAVVQYFDYIGGVLRGNLGKSLLTSRAVADDIAQALPATLELVLFTLFLIAVVAVPLGVVAARRHNSWIDNASRLVSLLGVVTPGFVFAILLQLLVSHFQFFPLTGRLSTSLGFVPDITHLALIDSLLKGRLDAFGDALSHIFLPALALSAAGIGQIMRITRSSMLDVARRDHVETLRSFGLPEYVITLKYMLRLAAVAPLTILGLEFASLIGNAFIVEMVFAWPGIASYGLRAILSKDFNAVMAVVLISGLFFVIANLIVDLLVGLIDPRLRAQGLSVSVGTEVLAPAEELSNFGRARRRLIGNPAAVIGIVIVISIVLAAILAPYISPYPGHAGSFVDFRHRHNAPSLEHLFGTDNVGRDILTRVLFGYRVSLLLVVGVLGVAVPMGVLFGLLAGYFGGMVETAIMWLTNVMLAVPPLVMALAITAVLTPDLIHSMIAITVLWWTWHCRLVYRVVKGVVAEDFVEAARVAGASHLHILFREILPNCAAAILVKTTLDAGFVILFGASLSFLGLGVQPPTPDLGTMVAAGAQFLPEMWWEAVMPGLAVLYAILGFNLLGDGLRDMLDVEI